MNEFTFPRAPSRIAAISIAASIFVHALLFTLVWSTPANTNDIYLNVYSQPGPIANAMFSIDTPRNSTKPASPKTPEEVELFVRQYGILALFDLMSPSVAPLGCEILSDDPEFLIELPKRCWEQLPNPVPVFKFQFAETR